MKQIVTGSYNKDTGSFRMHAPEFPYQSTTYIGYTLNEMKAKYRKDNKLQRRHIEWIIIGY